LSDFTTLKLQINSGASDASPTWTDVLFGTAGYELRAALSSGSQTTSTASASWPSITKPVSGTTLINKLYAFTADTTGFVITGADGTGSHYNVFRINWDALGTFASAPIISAWKDNTYPAASPGTQPGAGSGDGSGIVNGSADTSNTSYIKATAYGNGVTAAGAADNPSANMGSNPTATSGSAGAVSTVNATWSAWQSLQSATQFIQNGVTPKATTAGTWNLLIAEYIGAGLTGGVLLPVLGLSYSWI
jgi:hypothetical protein